MIWLSFIFAVGFVGIHLFSKRLKLLKVLPRSRFLSIAGGISVAYVFLHLLPELGVFQEELRESSKMAAYGFWKTIYT